MLIITFCTKNLAMRQAWDAREKHFRELWDAREMDFNKLMKDVGSVTKVKMTREVRVKTLERDDAKKYSRSEREATLEDFPEMMEEVKGLMSKWSKKPSSRLSLGAGLLFSFLEPVSSHLVTQLHPNFFLSGR